MDKDKIKQGVQLIIEGIGEDASREGLVETPDRIARMYEEIFAGLNDLSGIHNCHIVTCLIYNTEIMCNQNHCHITLSL